MNATASKSSALSYYRLLLTAAAIYDIVLGLVFLLLFGPVFGRLGIELPPNPIYLQLAAGCIGLFGLGFWYASRNPVRNIDLVRVGIGLKVLYVGLTAFAAATGRLPHPLFIVFAVLDGLFAIAVVLLWRHVPMPAD